MEYYLNPYSQILKSGKTITFYQPPSKNLLTPNIEIEGTAEQESLIKKLIDGQKIDKSIISNSIGEEKTEFLIQNNILINSKIDTEGIFSRTSFFYNQYFTKQTFKNLLEKKVLILGCGGIGSSVAWLLICMGVGNMTILDYDCVEFSNLNRMFMFNSFDVGKKKIDVLSQKLMAINPEANIKKVDLRIESESQLEEICKSDNYDLVIKALDSPSIFPMWLDNVCFKLGLPYVTGITLRDRVLIGPTFLPDKCPIGWSDIIQQEESTERIFGLVPSVGAMLFHVSDEIVIEAMKILLEKESLKYCGMIYTENIFSGEQEVIQSSRYPFLLEDNKPRNILHNVLIMLLLGCFSLISSKMLVVSFFASIIMPFISRSKKSNILKITFIDTTVFSIFLNYYVVANILGIHSFFGVISFLFVTVSIVNLINLIIVIGIINAVSFVESKM